MSQFGTAQSGFFSGGSSGGGGGVSSVGATPPITSTGGTTPNISTSIATNKLVGRYSSGSGVMQEVIVGDGLNLTSGGQLNNTATPTPLGYYGGWQDEQTQSAPSSNVGVAMIYRTQDVTPNGISIANDLSGNPTRITFANTGIYNLQFSSQFQNTDNVEHDVTIWIRLNGTDVAGSSGYVTVPKRRSVGAGLEGHVIVSWNYLLDVVAGQYYEIVWSTTDSTYVTMQYYSAGNPPPSTASVIITITQQSGIMAGTGVTAINTLTSSAQTMVVGTSGTNFAITSSGSTHTFDLPTASSTNRGALSTTDWSRFANFQVLTGYQTLGSTFKSILMSNPSISNITQSLTLATGQLRAVAVYVPIAQTITGLKWFQAVQGVFTGSGYNGVALFTYSGGTLTRVAFSTDSEATWETASANSWGSVAFATPYSASEGLYYVGLLYNGTGTAPAIYGTVNSINANVNIADFTNSAKLNLTLGSQTAMPSSVSMSGAGVAVIGQNPAVYLY